MDGSRSLRYSVYSSVWALALTVPVAVSAFPTIAINRNNKQKKSLEDVVNDARDLSNLVANSTAKATGISASATLSTTLPTNFGNVYPGGGPEPPNAENDSPHGGPPAVTIQAQSESSETAEHIMIAGGTVGATILIMFIVFYLIRWRKNMFKKCLPKSSRKEKPLPPTPAPDSNASERRQTMTERHPSTLFGGGSSGNSVNTRESQHPKMPFPPPPALVPSDDSLYRRESHPNLVRNSLLNRDQEAAATSNDQGQTFYLEDDVQEPTLALTAPPRYTKSPQPTPPVENSNSYFTITTANSNVASDASQGFTFPRPPIPDSPEMAHEASRFSWATNQDAMAHARSVRSSVESQPRFREITSWVAHQVQRQERSAKPSKLSLEQKPVETAAAGGSVPSTPAAFRHHPGRPVTFMAQHRRMESSDLDRQMMSTRGSEIGGAF
ncbi:hypothetical protein RUND412_006704 [Rhizina undulata]